MSSFKLSLITSYYYSLRKSSTVMNDVSRVSNSTFVDKIRVQKSMIELALFIL